MKEQVVLLCATLHCVWRREMHRSDIDDGNNPRLRTSMGVYHSEWTPLGITIGKNTSDFFFFSEQNVRLTWSINSTGPLIRLFLPMWTNWTSVCLKTVSVERLAARQSAQIRVIIVSLLSPAEFYQVSSFWVMMNSAALSKCTSNTHTFIVSCCVKTFNNEYTLQLKSPTKYILFRKKKPRKQPKLTGIPKNNEKRMKDWERERKEEVQNERKEKKGGCCFSDDWNLRRVTEDRITSRIKRAHEIWSGSCLPAASPGFPK